MQYYAHTAARVWNVDLRTFFEYADLPSYIIRLRKYFNSFISFIFSSPTFMIIESFTNLLTTIILIHLHFKLVFNLFSILFNIFLIPPDSLLISQYYQQTSLFLLYVLVYSYVISSHLFAQLFFINNLKKIGNKQHSSIPVSLIFDSLFLYISRIVFNNNINIPCGNGTEYFHIFSACRKRRLKKKPVTLTLPWPIGNNRPAMKLHTTNETIATISTRILLTTVPF